MNCILIAGVHKCGHAGGGIIKSKDAKDHTCRLETVEKFIGPE